MTRKQTILIVDDEPSNIFLYEGILEKEGYRVISATNGVEALEVVVKDPPDLVLTDLLMPNLHGFELVKELKAHEVSKDIPVIIATAVYKGPINKMEAQNAGADDFLEKPIDSDVLLEKIKAHLPSR